MVIATSFVMVLRRPLESALHTAIAVVDEAAAPNRPSLMQGLLQRVEHEEGVSRAGDTPADDAPGACTSRGSSRIADRLMACFVIGACFRLDRLRIGLQRIRSARVPTNISRTRT